MRPHKKVLVFGTNADELGRLSYVLRLRPYDVTLVISGVAALLALSQCDFDCALVLGAHGLPIAEAVTAALNGARPELPIVLVVPPKVDVAAPATVVCYGPDVARIVEAVRLLVKRKRGPKKLGSMRVPMDAVVRSGLRQAV